MKNDIHEMNRQRAAAQLASSGAGPRARAATDAYPALRDAFGVGVFALDPAARTMIEAEAGDPNPEAARAVLDALLGIDAVDRLRKLVTAAVLGDHERARTAASGLVEWGEDGPATFLGKPVALPEDWLAAQRGRIAADLAAVERETMALFPGDEPNEPNE